MVVRRLCLLCCLLADVPCTLVLPIVQRPERRTYASMASIALGGLPPGVCSRHTPLRKRLQKTCNSRAAEVCQGVAVKCKVCTV